MLAVQIIFLIVGLVLLVKGADWFVEGSAGIAEKCKISPLVIGLTVVAFGTSMPELAVSVTSAIEKSTDIAIGNVVGSNIANILLILGVSALLHNLPVQKESLWLDLPVLLLASVLLLGLGWWGREVSWYDGLVLLLVFSAYMTILLVQAGKKRKAMLLLPEEERLSEEEPASGGRQGGWMHRMEQKVWFLIVLVLVGLGMVVGGGTLLVDAATYIAKYAGVTERVIGLTVVAVGTSLPELVTSVVAAAKGQTDIAVGNVIGSSIFNIFMVAGFSALVYPLGFTAGNGIDALVALGAAVLLFVLSFFQKHQLGKPAGVLFLCGFVAYYVYLFLA